MTKLHIDVSQAGPRYALPQLLIHPQIPSQLSGINPRTIMGREWWDTQRHIAYEKNNYHCWACGRRTAGVRFRRALEAHEVYDINAAAGELHFLDVVALCSPCHMFIHSGRMYARVIKGRFKRKYAEYVLKRGCKLLRDNGLEPFWATRATELMLIHGVDSATAKRQAIQEVIARDPKIAERSVGFRLSWYLLFDGRRYTRVDGIYYSEVDEKGRRIGDRHPIKMDW